MPWRKKTGRELADHEAVSNLHRARAAKERSIQALDFAVRVNNETDDALDKARLEVRRAAERR